MISIFGATGNTGSEVARHLSRAGHSIRIVSRDAGKAQALRQSLASPVEHPLGEGSPERETPAAATPRDGAPGSVEVCIWNPEKPEDFLAALDGARSAYFMCPVGLKDGSLFAFRDSYSKNFAWAARKQNLDQVVQLSSFGAHLRKNSGVLEGLFQAEQNLAGCAQRVRILRPGYFWQNFRSNVQGVMERNFLGGYPLEAQTRLYFADTRDIGAHAAALLQETSPADPPGTPGTQKSPEAQSTPASPGTSGTSDTPEIYSVYHPQDYSFEEIGQALAVALDKPHLTWTNLGYQAARDFMAAQSTPQDLIDNFIAFFRAINEGRASETLEDYPVLECSRGLQDFVSWFTQLCYTTPEA